MTSAFEVIGEYKAGIEASLAEQADVLAATAASVSALQQSQTAETNSGISAVEPFEYVNSSALDSGLWDVSYTEGSATQGAIAVEDGHNAGMKLASSSGAATELARYIGTNNVTLTDYQFNTVVVASAMSAQGWFDTRTPSIDVYARVKSDESAWVRFRWFVNGTIRCEYKNGGSITQLGSDTTGQGNPAAGTRISIEAGTAGAARNFRLWRNDSAIVTVPDGSSVTALGASYRGTGWGQRVDNGLMPGKIKQFAMADNTPAAVVGSVLQVIRSIPTATSTVGFTSGGASAPANTFDTVEYQTPTISWNGATSEATVNVTGTYLISFALHDTATFGQGESGHGAVYLNGSLKRILGNNVSVPASGGSYIVDTPLGGSCSLYLAAGDVIKPGLHFSAGHVAAVGGDTSGQRTWFSMVLVSS